MVMTSYGKGTMSVGWSYLRFLGKARDLVHDMHSNRFKQTLCEVPSFMVPVVDACKLILPSKFASRVRVVGSIKDLEQYLVPVGGKAPTADEWMEEKYKKYQETVEKLTLQMEEM